MLTALTEKVTARIQLLLRKEILSLRTVTLREVFTANAFREAVKSPNLTRLIMTHARMFVQRENYIPLMPNAR